jgi:hypothetical protein
MGNDIINQLKRTKSNLSKPHNFDFYLYFPTRYEANQATIELLMEGLNCEMKPGAVGNDWLCLVSIQLVPEETELAKLENIFVKIATAHHGEYDGWESNVVQ